MAPIGPQNPGREPAVKTNHSSLLVRLSCRWWSIINGQRRRQQRLPGRHCHFPSAHSLFLKSESVFGETCDRKRPATSPSLTSSISPTSASREPGSNPSYCKPAYGGCSRNRTGFRMKAQGRGYAIERTTGDLSGCPNCRPPGRKIPDSPDKHRSAERYRLRRQGFLPSNGGHQPVRLGLCVPCPIERTASECIVVAVQSLWELQAVYEGAPRKTANVQSASTSRQCLPGTFQGVILSRRPRRLRRAKGT